MTPEHWTLSALLAAIAGALLGLTARTSRDGAEPISDTRKLAAGDRVRVTQTNGTATVSVVDTVSSVDPLSFTLSQRHAGHAFRTVLHGASGTAVERLHA